MSAERESQAKRMAGTARDMEAQRRDPEATYKLAAQIAHTNIDGCDGAALSIVQGRKAIETVASTSDLATELDQLQYDLGEGPCLDKLWEQPMVYTADLGKDDRWPKWGVRAVELTAVKSMVACRVFTHGNSLGVLNLYSQGIDAFDYDAQEEAAAIAAHVAIAVAASHEVGHLTMGLDSRTIIGQATGILMGRLRLSPDVAFKVLVRYSSSSERKLRDVAAEVVLHGGLPESSKGPRPGPRG